MTSNKNLDGDKITNIELNGMKTNETRIQLSQHNSEVTPLFSQQMGETFLKSREQDASKYSAAKLFSGP